MYEHWECSYCRVLFWIRSQWVYHLKVAHDIEENNIVEPWDRGLA